MKKTIVCGFLMAVVVLLISRSAPAQWVAQSVRLQAGWNAVHLLVQPEPPDIASWMAGTDVESVWRWNIRYTTVQFALDPSQILGSETDWLVWLPPTHPQAFLNNLYLFQGGVSYLVRVASNAAPFTLSIKGRPVLPRIHWYPNALHFTGLPVDPGNPPLFADFFRYTPDIGVSSLEDGGRILALTPGGTGREIINPHQERVQSGVAYWIQAKSVSDYTGPVVASPDYGDGLDFGVAIQERTLNLKNTATNRGFTVTLSMKVSEEAPVGATPVAGPVPLSYFVLAPESNLVDWVSFPAELTCALAPGETRSLRLAVRRQELSEPGLYQSLLTVRESGGLLSCVIPVSAEQP